MYKVEIYDEQAFITAYPVLHAKITQLLQKAASFSNFEFTQCLSLDGNMFEIRYTDPNNEDIGATLEADNSNLVNFSFDISID
jgi:sensor histidine kinase regulating citrate/malate metabolism